MTRCSRIMVNDPLMQKTKAASVRRLFRCCALRNAKRDAALKVGRKIKLPYGPDLQETWRDGNVKRFGALSLAAGSLLVAFAANAQEGGVARPNLVLKQTSEDMPRGDKQEISILTATLKPGDKTVFHTHRFPVSVYILEGTFTLEMDGGAAEREDDGLQQERNRSDEGGHLLCRRSGNTVP
jgi:hypothetical protein